MAGCTLLDSYNRLTNAYIDIDIDIFITPNKHDKYNTVSAFEQHKKVFEWMTLKKNNIYKCSKVVRRPKVICIEILKH